MLMPGRRSLSREDIKAADKDEKETLLEHDSDPDEDMLFSRPGTSNGDEKIDNKMDCVRLQIQEVTDVMRDNVQKVIDRGERLEDLQEASDRLNMAGNEFREAARRAQRKAWLQNVKSKIIIISITVTVVLFIIDCELKTIDRCIYSAKLKNSKNFSFTINIFSRFFLIQLLLAEDSYFRNFGHHGALLGSQIASAMFGVLIVEIKHLSS